MKDRIIFRKQCDKSQETQPKLKMICRVEETLDILQIYVFIVDNYRSERQVYSG